MRDASGSRATQEALATSMLTPEPRKVAMGLIAEGNWVFMATQPVLTVAKYVLLTSTRTAG